MKSTNINVSEGTCQEVIAVNRLETLSKSFGLNFYTGGLISGDCDQCSPFQSI